MLGVKLSKNKNATLGFFANIEWQNILSIKESISKNEKIYLYCRSGNRSGKATKILIDAGFTNVTNAGSMSQAGELLDLKIVKK